jgi:beta-carotene ketolase (CrtO type)
MTITEEITLPGFRSDIHAFGYQLGNLFPVPNELRLDNYGFELIPSDTSYTSSERGEDIFRCIKT